MDNDRLDSILNELEEASKEFSGYNEVYKNLAKVVEVSKEQFSLIESLTNLIRENQEHNTSDFQKACDTFSNVAHAIHQNMEEQTKKIRQFESILDTNEDNITSTIKSNTMDLNNKVISLENTTIKNFAENDHAIKNCLNSLTQLDKKINISYILTTIAIILSICILMKLFIQ